MYRRPLTVLTVAVTAAVFTAGCSKVTQQATTSSKVPVSAPHSGAASAPTGDIGRGKIIFKEKCEMCHGVNGADGGVGPALKNERKRKNLAQAIAWIKNPRSPMPKYYPAELDEKGVADVAAFVESL